MDTSDLYIKEISKQHGPGRKLGKKVSNDPYILTILCKVAAYIL